MIKKFLERRWYALYVNVRHEKKIMHKLQEKGMEAYLPVVKRMRQWIDRKKLVEMPLFTGYVFVKLHAAEMDKPRFVEGVINFLKFENKPAVIRNEEIEGLKYFVDHGYYIVVKKRTIIPGRRVKICLSQFNEYPGIVESIARNKSVTISFEGIRMNLTVKVPLEALEAI